MSDIDEQSDTEGYKCPYCMAQHICDDWGYDYDGEIMTCDSCDKKFYASANHTVDFDSAPDCELNGIEHDLEFYKEYGEYNSYFCEICNKCILKNKDSEV